MPEIDEQLTKEVKNGNKEAFGEIYRIFLDRIYRFTYFLVHDEHQAEDITQNTFLKAWKNIKSFSEKRGSMQSFLYAIARNLVIDYQRKKKSVILDVEIQSLLPSNDDLEEDIVNKEEREKLAGVLQSLSEDDREIIILKYFEDMDYKEISKITGKKEGAIRVKMFRALKILKQKLNE